MNREALVASVKKNYAKADEATIDAVLKTLQDAKADWRLTEQLPAAVKTGHASDKDSKTLEFVGEHLTPDEYRKLSFDERGDLKLRLKKQNRQWLDEKFANLQAAWLMVLDGEIIAYGASLRDYPRIEKIREISSRYGKRPFIFVNDLFVVIEESNIGWHSTVYPDDFYPTVPVILRTDYNAIELAADFDTGAASSFVDYDMLLSHAIIEASEEEEGEGAEHLGQTFKYASKLIKIEIKLPTGKIVQCEYPILCVSKWQNSPFVRVNPHRTALAGRDLLLELQPAILLDFANHRTRLVAPEQAQNS